jgi:hypothetical protein
VVAYPLERLTAEHTLVQSDLSGDDAGQLLQYASGQLDLERPYGGQRHARDRASMPERHGKHIMLRQHRNVRAPSLQLLTGHGSAGEQHLVRERPAEAVFQDVGRAHARREAVLHEIGAVHPVSGHHHDVRVETEREPAARGVPLDGDDDRAVASQHALVEEGHVGEPALFGGERPQSLRGGSHAENAAVSGDDHGPDVVATRDLRERGLQTVQEPVGEHVRPGVHRHEGHALVDAESHLVAGVRFHSFHDRFHRFPHGLHDRWLHC